MIKLGSKTKDTITGLEGVCVHRAMEMNGAMWLNFQPASLDPETMEPSKRFWLTDDRLKGGERQDFVFPTAILGSRVRHPITGFSGIVTSLSLHINGCLHASVQPRGKSKSGTRFDPQEFDIRELEGPAIKSLSAQEADASKRDNPSPSAMVRYSPGK
jgi:hypothetical protein